jgi:hypothetical protein
MSLPNGTDTTTALALVFEVPELTTIRQQYDRAYPRWPNLIFPFVPLAQFGEVRNQLQVEFKEQAPFSVKMEQLESFKQGKQRTYHVAFDQSELHQVFRRVRAALPNVPLKHVDFHPHLTLAQGTGLEQELAEKLLPLSGEGAGTPESYRRYTIPGLEIPRIMRGIKRQRVSLACQRNSAVFISVR